MTAPEKMLNVDIRPEASLLLLCSRTKLDEGFASRIRELLASPLDWNYVEKTAYRNGVAPLLHRSLMAVGANSVPQATISSLHDYVRSTVRHNMLLTGELRRLLRLFEAHSIPAAPFKGPILAAQVYGDLGLREFGDLDILIHEQDFLRAKELLLTHGYQPVITISDRQEAAHLKNHHDFPLVRNDGKVFVELQWGVMQEPFRFPPDFTQWWHRFEPVTLVGQTMLNLPPEDLLLILCVHGCKHLWERLSWVCDIAEMIRVYRNLEWTSLTDRAVALGARRMLWIGLLLADELLSAELPEDIRLRARTDSIACALVDLARTEIFREDERPSTIDNDAPLFYLRMHERWRDRARLYVRFYPSLQRPVQLWRKYGLELLKPLLRG